MISEIEYKKRHSALISRGKFIEKVIVRELSKVGFFNDGSNNINGELVNFHTIMKNGIKIVFREFTLPHLDVLGKNKKFRIDLLLWDTNKFYLIEIKSGSSHESSSSASRVLDVLQLGKNELLKKGVPDNMIVKVILSTNNYQLLQSERDVKVLSIDEFSELVNLPNFAQNVKEERDSFDIEHDID